jgi:hypothetical protein
MHSKQCEHWWALENSREVTIDFTNSERDLPMYSEPHLQDRMNLDDRGSESNLAALRDDSCAMSPDGSLNRLVRSFRP